MVGFGFIQDWWVLIPLRLLLGLFEAGYFPGVVVSHALIRGWSITYMNLGFLSEQRSIHISRSLGLFDQYMVLSL